MELPDISQDVKKKFCVFYPPRNIQTKHFHTNLIFFPGCTLTVSIISKSDKVRDSTDPIFAKKSGNRERHQKEQEFIKTKMKKKVKRG